MNSAGSVSYCRALFSRAAAYGLLAAMAAAFAGCATADRWSPAVAESTAATVHCVPAAAAWGAAEALASTREGDFVLAGAGDSMRPWYGPGTVLVVHPTSYFMLRRGMPIVYTNRAGHQVAHVLVEEGATGWVAQGLNNREPDEEPVTAANLVGIVRCAFVPDVRAEAVTQTAPLVANSHHLVALLH